MEAIQGKMGVNSEAKNCIWQVPLSPWQQMPQYNVSTKCCHMITIIKANEFKFYFRELH